MASSTRRNTRPSQPSPPAPSSSRCSTPPPSYRHPIRACPPASPASPGRVRSLGKRTRPTPKAEMSRTAATEAEGDDTDDEIILVAIKKQRQGQEKENDRPDPESSDDEDQDDEVEDVKKALLAPPQRVRACRVVSSPATLVVQRSPTKTQASVRCTSPSRPTSPTPSSSRPMITLTRPIATIVDTGKSVSRESDDLPSLPTPAHTPTKPFANVFSHAKHLLRLASISASANSALEDGTAWEGPKGREKEQAALQRFLASRFPGVVEAPAAPAASPDRQAMEVDTNPSPVFVPKPAKSLYVSGPPGTGKTHLLSSLLTSPRAPWHRDLEEAGVRVVLVNCVGLGGAAGEEDVWRKVRDAMGLEGKRGPARNVVEACVREKQGRKCLVILDEIDHLLPKRPSDASSLAAIYSLSHSAPEAHFTVIGIANALDLTARMSLASPASSQPSNDDEEEEEEETPELLHFSPYGADEMQAIVIQRLSQLCDSYLPASTTPVTLPAGKVPLFMPPALRLCATKVAAVTGDLRTFLSVLRRAVETLETTTRQKRAGSNTGLLTPSSTPTKGGRHSSGGATDALAGLTPLTAPVISPPDIIKLFRSTPLTVASPEVECARRLENLNLHQRLALISLCVAWHRTGAEVGVDKDTAYEVYRRALKGDGIRENTIVSPMAEGEWSEVVSSGLQVVGLVRVGSGSTGTGTSATSMKRTASASGAGNGAGGRPPIKRAKTSPSTSRTWGASSASPRFTPAFPLSALLPALLAPCPASSDHAGFGTAAGGSDEALGMVTLIWDRDQRRQKREKKRREREVERKREEKMAPREGWDGTGLDGKEGEVLGGRKGARDEEDGERQE